HFYLAYPVRVDETVYGVAATEIAGRPPAQLQSAMRQLQWGVAWLENWILRQKSKNTYETANRLGMVLEIGASALQEPRFKAAATACVTELASRLDCDRVSVGFLLKDKVEVVALSHSAQFGKQMNLIRAIGEAMDESLDQAALLTYPARRTQTPLILRAHAELARNHATDNIITIPFLNNEGKGFGALTLERTAGQRQEFSAETITLCDAVAAFIGPLLHEKRLNDRPLVGRISDILRDQAQHFLGPGQLPYKLTAVIVFLLVLFFAVAKGDYRVTAKTTLEGTIQRAVTAPFDGYLEEAGVRAGDLVDQNQIMARLSDRDLRLERSKWASQWAQHQLEHRKAMAEGETAAASILQEQMRQAEAELALLDEKLARTSIPAPFAGIVVSGDLSQSLGSPMEKGQILFEVAPLDAYRVMLEVDEMEIGEMHIGQHGELILSAMPGNPLSFTVNKITPVSVAKEGRSYFTVEASLDEPSPRLRPGMEGYGKISVDRRRLIWVWTHDLIDWLRIRLWSWLP
ncbi:MAG: hypothetical protein A2496_00500, partial [Burkholderiales bacterium RIFOXYC12_FULL_60_6]